MGILTTLKGKPHTPSSRWSIQNELNGVFVEFLCHIAFFGHFFFFALLVFCLYMVSNLVFLWVLGVCVFSRFSLVFDYIFCLLVCLLSRERERRDRDEFELVEWEVGRI